MGSEMTYDELLRMYIAAGGQTSAAEGDLFSPQRVMLPDGTAAVMAPDQSLTHYTGIVPGHAQDGGGANRTLYGAGGVTDLGWQSGRTGDEWLRSLLGAAAVGVGGPLLGAAGNAIAGSLGGAGSSLAGAGSGFVGEGAGAGELGFGTGALMPGAGAGAAVPELGFGTGALGPAVMPGGPANLTFGGPLPGEVGFGTGAMMPGPAPGVGGAFGSIGSALGGVGSALASNPALIGAGLGALAGAAGSGPEMTTQAQDLPEWLRPYAQSYLARADALSQQPFQSYTGQRVANLSDDQQRAMTQIRDLATHGDPLVNQARGQQGNVIGGSMLGANPYIDAVASDIGRQMGDAYAIGTRAKMAGNAALSGNTGSAGTQQALGMADESFARGLGSTMNNLYYGNYANERAAQDAASRSSLGFGTFGRGNTEGLLNSGSMQRGVTQDILGANYDEWQQRQAWPSQQLGILGGAINPGFGRTSTTTDPGVSTWQGLLGGAATGAGVARSLFGGPSTSLYGGSGMNFGPSNGRTNEYNYLSQFGGM